MPRVSPQIKFPSSSYIIQIGGYTDPNGLSASAAILLKNGSYKMHDVSVHSYYENVDILAYLIGLELAIDTCIQYITVETSNEELMDMMCSGWKSKDADYQRVARSYEIQFRFIQIRMVPKNTYLIEICRLAIEQSDEFPPGIEDIEDENP